VVREHLVVVVDLEKYPVTVGVECTEVMFFVWVVGVAEIVVHSDGPDDPFDGFLAERRNTRCDDCDAAKQMLAELVVERTNLISLSGHDRISFVGVGADGWLASEGNELVSRADGTMVKLGL
jgi:hypothetical protein